MAILCNEKCGQCAETSCISHQINQRIEKSIHETNHPEVVNNGAKLVFVRGHGVRQV